MKVKLTILLRPDSSEDKGYKIIVVDDDQAWLISLSDDIKLHEGLAVDIPDISQVTQKDLTLKAIETLRERKVRRQAELQQELNDLDARIEKLLMLTYLPTVPDPDMAVGLAST